MTVQHRSWDLTDDQYELAERLEKTLHRRHRTWFTPSALGRLVKADTTSVRTVLAWMVHHQIGAVADRDPYNARTRFGYRRPGAA